MGIQEVNQNGMDIHRMELLDYARPPPVVSSSLLHTSTTSNVM